MRRILCRIFWLSLGIALAWGAPAFAAGGFSHTFFSTTQYPLTVHYLRGETPGPTIMVQGGIQGDEPSGFLSAQLLTRAKVKSGNLIIVPRANVPSINKRSRQVNVDLNRRFDKDYNRFYEDRLARAIRFLMREADGFIHLHEGSGFYDPVYKTALRNPKRYGQSVIIDTTVFKNRIHLADTVEKVLKEVNPLVKPAKYRFKLFNTRTFDPDTPYPQMRKSLTCYALAEVGIPALAVEVSKDIKDTAWKVRQQLLVTVKLLESLGVACELPKHVIETASHDKERVRVLVNGKPLTSSSVSLTPGGVLSVGVQHEKGSDMEPAISVFTSDRPTLNMAGGQRLALAPFGHIEVRSDGMRIRKAQVRWQGSWPKGAAKDDSAAFVCWLNGNPHYVSDGGTLTALEGDQLVLDGVWGTRVSEVINLKGYVATPWKNDGQDAGEEIILDKDNFISKYVVRSPGLPGWKLRVVRETKGKPRGEFFIRVMPREVFALRLAPDFGQPVVAPFSDAGQVSLAPGRYKVRDVWSNGEQDKIALTVGNLPLPMGGVIEVHHAGEVDLTLRQATTFAPIGTIRIKGASFASRTTGG